MASHAVHARNKVARAVRNGLPDDEIERLREEIIEAKIRDLIEKAPPLRPDQVDRLVSIFRVAS